MLETSMLLHFLCVIGSNVFIITFHSEAILVDKVMVLSKFYS